MVDSTTFVPVRKLISDPGVVPVSPFICTDASRNYNRLSAYWLQPRGTLGPMQIGLHGLGGLAACCAACAAGRACTGCLNGITTGRYITTGVFSPGVSGIQEIATSIQDKTDGYGVPVLIGASIGYLAKKKSGAVAGALAGAGLTWAFGRYVQPIVASVFGAGSLGGFRDDFRLNPVMTDADTPLDRSAFRFLQLILIVGASTLAFKVLKKRKSNGRRRNARLKFSHGQAIESMQAAGVDFNEDFHALPASTVDKILAWAKATRYQKSPGAPGSRARMYFQYLARMSRKPKGDWK